MIFSPKSVPGTGSLPFFSVSFQPGFGCGFAEMTPAGTWMETDFVGEPSQP